MPIPLTDPQITDALTALPGWSREGDKLTKTYTFSSFREAMGFIVRVGFEAEAMNHHPELFNVYSRVTISLCTHDLGDKISDSDAAMAKAIEQVVSL